MRSGNKKKTSTNSSTKNISFEKISDDVLFDNIFPFLDEKSKVQFALSCWRTYNLFNESIAKLVIVRLLKHVVRGEQNETEKMLKLIPALLFRKDTVTDYSGRTFKNWSVLQCAAWALDTHMLKMMLKYIPEGQKLEALEQLNELDKKETEHGAHYDFSPLIDALQTCVNQYRVWSVDQYVKHWCEVVGGAQRLVPVHVANEYCHPRRSFSPTPTFTEDHLPRNLQFYDWTKLVKGTGSFSLWFPMISVSHAFAISGSLQLNPPYTAIAHRCGWPPFSTGVHVLDAPASSAACDLAAMIALHERRMAELVEIKQRLLNPVPVSTWRCVIF